MNLKKKAKSLEKLLIPFFDEFLEKFIDKLLKQLFEYLQENLFFHVYYISLNKSVKHKTSSFNKISRSIFENSCKSCFQELLQDYCWIIVCEGLLSAIAPVGVELIIPPTVILESDPLNTSKVPLRVFFKNCPRINFRSSSGYGFLVVSKIFCKY